VLRTVNGSHKMWSEAALGVGNGARAIHPWTTRCALSRVRHKIQQQHSRGLIPTSVAFVRFHDPKRLRSSSSGHKSRRPISYVAIRSVLRTVLGAAQPLEWAPYVGSSHLPIFRYATPPRECTPSQPKSLWKLSLVAKPNYFNRPLSRCKKQRYTITENTDHPSFVYAPQAHPKSLTFRRKSRRRAARWRRSFRIDNYGTLRSVRIGSNSHYGVCRLMKSV